MDGMEAYHYSLEYERDEDEDMHETSPAETSNHDLLKQLVPYSTLEPELPPDELLKA